MTLANSMANRIMEGLSRKSIISPSRWAEKYRVMGPPYPGPWDFRHHPWLKELHDSKAELNIGQKASQVGYTETVLNRAFFMIDVRKMDVLYVLPNKNPDASDFSSGRFDKALELSPHLQNMFSDVKNIGHKRAGYANLYIRGSNSRSQLKSIPVSFIVLDEVDEMTQEHIPLAMERVSGQLERYVWMVSTPTIPGKGINFYYEKSTQELFSFKCPSCSRFIDLKFPDNLKIIEDNLSDSYLFCKACKATLEHEDKINFLKDGQWVPQHKQRESRGFYINHLYAMHIKPSKIATAFVESKTDIHLEQEFWNSKLGLTHTVEGAKLTPEDISNCIENYVMTYTRTGELLTMGVDVGYNFNHVVINQWDTSLITGYDPNAQARAINLFHAEVASFNELDKLMQDFNIAFCVVDANPERRLALEFANRFYGRVKLCYYTDKNQGKIMNSDEYFVAVDRTSWIETAVSRFRSKTIKVPRDTREEFKKHLTAITKVPQLDRRGNPVSRYVTANNEQDHYAHALTYAEIALPLALGIGQLQPMSETP